MLSNLTNLFTGDALLQFLKDEKCLADEEFYEYYQSSTIQEHFANLLILDEILSVKRAVIFG